jgi:hypothetical protein
MFIDSARDLSGFALRFRVKSADHTLKLRKFSDKLRGEV